MLLKAGMHPPLTRPAFLYTGFMSFKPDRFRFRPSTQMSLREWLFALPSIDHKPEKRYKSKNILHMIRDIDVFVSHLGSETAEGTLARVSSDITKTFTKPWQQLPAVLKRDIENAPPCAIPEVHMFALLVYSYELYEDYASDEPETSCPYQLYSELNRVCRECGHSDAIEGECKREWTLFKPFLVHLDAAIRVLQPVECVLFRGMSRNSKTYHYPIGTQGAWGGCLSCSSERMQGALFVSKENQLHATDGSFFMILSDQARPMYHLSRSSPGTLQTSTALFKLSLFH